MAELLAVGDTASRDKILDEAPAQIQKFKDAYAAAEKSMTGLQGKIDKATSTINRLSTKATLNDNEQNQLNNTNKNLKKYNIQLFAE